MAYLDLCTFIHIPFMALTAFLFISLMMLVSRLAPFEQPATGASTGPLALLAPAALPVYAIIVVVVGAYVVGAQLR